MFGGINPLKIVGSQHIAVMGSLQIPQRCFTDVRPETALTLKSLKSK